MDRRRFLAGATTVTAGSLAGCLSDSDRDVEYRLLNTDERQYDIRVSVLPETDTQVEVKWESRNDLTRDAAQLGELLETDPSDITAIEPLAEPVQVINYNLAPSDDISDTLEAVRDEEAIIVVSQPADESRAPVAWGSWNCDSLPLRNFEIHFSADGQQSFAGSCSE